MKKILRALLGDSWKTTTLGILQFVAILASELTTIVEAQPEADPNIGVILTSAVTAVALRLTKEKISGQ